MWAACVVQMWLELVSSSRPVHFCPQCCKLEWKDPGVGFRTFDRPVCYLLCAPHMIAVKDNGALFSGPFFGWWIFLKVRVFYSIWLFTETAFCRRNVPLFSYRRVSLFLNFFIMESFRYIQK